MIPTHETPWSRTVLRLSGRGPEPLERKSETPSAAAVFRRFFRVLARLELRGRGDADRDAR